MTNVVCYGTDWNCIKEQLLLYAVGIVILVLGFFVFMAVSEWRRKKKRNT